jgi:protein phosphatase
VISPVYPPLPTGSRAWHPLRVRPPRLMTAFIAVVLGLFLWVARDETGRAIVMLGGKSHLSEAVKLMCITMRLNVGAATDIGRVRGHNEDQLAVRPDLGLFVVCDGMGGTAAGEVASQMAVDTILAALKAPGPGTTSGSTERGYLAQTSRLEQAVQLSNRDIYDQSQRDASQAEMGTTVVAAWIHHDIASVAHVGDSRAYHWHAGSFEPITRDHSLVEEQVRAGLISREESLQSEQQNILTRALGREPDVTVDLAEVPVQPGDYLLLCSDGLTRMVSEGQMAQAIAELRDPQQICDSLIAAANRGGGPDNITVVVVEVVGSRTRGVWNRWRRQA